MQLNTSKNVPRKVLIYVKIEIYLDCFGSELIGGLLVWYPQNYIRKFHTLVLTYTTIFFVANDSQKGFSLPSWVGKCFYGSFNCLIFFGNFLLTFYKTLFKYRKTMSYIN